MKYTGSRARLKYETRANDVNILYMSIVCVWVNKGKQVMSIRWGTSRFS